MESVEELCDHIALINKSHKILDGKLIDIKRAYKNNQYEVGLKLPEEQKMVLLAELKDKFEVSEANFKTLYDELKLYIKQKEGETANNLLQYLTTKAEVTHFVESIPTVDEIFISTINKLAD